MDKLTQWWQDYSSREQIILGSLGIVLVVFLFYVLAIAPVMTWRSMEQNRLARVQAERIEVNQLVARIKSEKTIAGGLKDNDNLAVLINNSLNENNLIMRGFQPGSKNDARLRLEDVAYSSLTQWLYDLEYRHGVNIEDLSLTPSKFPGRLMVSVRVSHR
jgi:general secretion pathway protein M